MHRRHFLRGAGACAAATLASSLAHGAGAAKRPIILVHGAWHGGWCWERVTPLLEKAGHKV